MLMLTAYLDETGHSKDEKQRFNGMAGLLAPASHWEQFEAKWKAALTDYKIPHFHAKDWANRRQAFEGWSELKRRKLYGKLMRIIATTYAVPFGAMIPMDIFRSFTKEQQGYFVDPYYFAFMTCAVAGADYIDTVSPTEETLAMVFSEQMEFRHISMQLFDLVKQSDHSAAHRLDAPVFRSMDKLVPLQAADLVAYEYYKECERRRYRPGDKPRWGYLELEKIRQRSWQTETLAIHNETTLGMHIRNAEDVIAEMRQRRAEGA